jgi:hypothetical protein
LPFGRASIFLREGENVQDEQQDILYRAAEVWKEPTEYHYVFTYGYKGELHEIKLTFSPEDFPRLAGFHYLKYIALPRYSPRKTVDMILSDKIHLRQGKEGHTLSGVCETTSAGTGAVERNTGTGVRFVFLYAPVLSVRDQNQSGLLDFQPD